VTYQEAILLLATLIALPDATGSKAAIIAIAQAAGLDATDFVDGDPAERFLEIAAQAMAAWNVVPTQAGKALFFSLATDPGDVDDFGNPDPSPNQTPRPGWLSAAGQSLFNTVRGGQAFATAFVTITNTGGTATSAFHAGDLTFEQTGALRSDGGTPTYISTADPTIYNGPGGTLVLAAGAQITIPVQALQIGNYGSSPLNGINVCVTQSFGTLAVNGSTTATGQERELRSLYIARCIRAADRWAIGGPPTAYLFAMNTMLDPDTGLFVPLQRYDGSGPVNITTAYVSTSSATGAVVAYYAGADGAVDSTDVSSANANIEGVLLADSAGNYQNEEPLGVMGDVASFTGSSATNTTIAVTYTARIKASSIPGGATPGTYTTGGSPPTNIAKIFTTIQTAIGAYLVSTGVGGLDQVSGAGVVYTSDIQDSIRDAFAGLYGVSVSAPGGSSTAIALGHIAQGGTVTGTLVVV
jgi:hypothetical protein